MATIWVKELTGGLDARRLPETTSGGVLIRGEDGHINRGGEFEKRAAFVPTYSLPAGTVNLAANLSHGVYVFGSASTPAGLPAGVSYQRLQNSATTLLRVRSYDLYAGLIYAVGEFSNGARLHFYDGAVVTDWPDGRATATFQVAGGNASSTVNITVGGVAIMSGAITWATSNTATATAIAAEINSNPSSPEYSAVSDGEFVTIIAAIAAAATNGLAVLFTIVSNFTVVPDIGLAMQGGIDTTFPEPGTFVRTIGSKVYALAGPYLVSSGVQTPTNWSTATGKGFIDMSQQTSGSEDLTALADYQSSAAVLAERLIQIWTLAGDVASSVPLQKLRNTGTASPRSVTQFGDADVFYLDESGLRSLKARYASNAAATSGIGVYVDPLIVAKLRSLTADERAKIIGLIEPQDGRFWLIMKDTIFVFTYFPEAKISAWTTYSTHYFDEDGNQVAFTVDDAVVFNRRVYLRSGDTILVYGGLTTGQDTDKTEAVAWPPYLDGDAPTTSKRWQSFDAAVLGEWGVTAAMSLRDTTVEEPVAVITRTTYNEERLAQLGESTHISLRFRSRGTGPRKLSAFAIHYESDEADK